MLVLAKVPRCNVELRALEWCVHYYLYSTWYKSPPPSPSNLPPSRKNMIKNRHSTFRFRFESRSEWLNEKKEDRGRMSGIGIRQIGPECVFIETWIIDSWLIITVTYITANVTIRNRQNWRIVITWVRQPCSKFRTVAKCNWARELMKTKISQNEPRIGKVPQGKFLHSKEK